MSFNRNPAQDRAATLAVLLGQRLPCDGTVERGREVNWLGHGVETGAAQIDQMLLEGATQEELAEARDVDTHLYHLRTEHGLPVVEVDGEFRFNQADL